ncbi:hypothetical protein CPC08DRAFT_677464 [Agrocybe pediades]|nr:hypothetical protein CPC08DRAFT_677464 [Agrocybe pediades]
MARIPIFFLFLSFITLTYALDIAGKIAWNAACPNATTLGQARASLNEGAYSGGINSRGEFTIPDVPEGTYILSILAHDFYFDQVRVDLLPNDTLPEIRPYVPGTPLDPPSSIVLPYPIVLSARDKFNYFVPPESFNLASMLANPMMLLMVGGAGMMLLMPYLIKNLDPEALEELKEQQSKMSGLQSALQSGDFKAGLSSIMSAVDDQGQSSSTTPSKSGSSARQIRGNNRKAKR